MNLWPCISRLLRTRSTASAYWRNVGSAWLSTMACRRESGSRVEGSNRIVVIDPFCEIPALKHLIKVGMTYARLVDLMIEAEAEGIDPWEHYQRLQRRKHGPNICNEQRMSQ